MKKVILTMIEETEKKFQSRQNVLVQRVEVCKSLENVTTTTQNENLNGNLIDKFSHISNIIQVNSFIFKFFRERRNLKILRLRL